MHFNTTCHYKEQGQKTMLIHTNREEIENYPWTIIASNLMHDVTK